MKLMPVSRSSRPALASVTLVSLLAWASSALADAALDRFANPSAEALQRACDRATATFTDATLSPDQRQAQQDQEIAANVAELADSPDAVELWTPLGSAYFNCAYQARLGNPEPNTPNMLPELPFYLFVFGRVQDVKFAKDWDAEVQVLDASGTVLKTVVPYESYRGTKDDWGRDCSTCAYTGRNSYLFSQLDFANQPGGVALRIVVERDGKKEQFTLDEASHPQLR